MNERDLFIAALQIEDAAERAAYLDRACAGETALRQRVEALLAAFDQAGSFLQQPAGDPRATSEVSHPGPRCGGDPAEGSGTVIGPYKLIEQIGEGGMGTVWMAQQTEPVKRLVAIKLVKAGMDSRQVIARFEAERQALALMDHPNIAKVLEAGTTGAGRPYFVMDLVKGVPITRYCDEHLLTPRQRLELFVPVCQAVQHAHQKGIIHRDLKPSNVLVALYDGKPVPKVIDFGVAKAAGQSLTDKTLVTGFGAIVGTLEYMSPEQAEVNQLDIDTRSDNYSLGVLLYELLAGSPPFTRKEVENAGMLEMLRLIREQEPTKPSTRLSTAEGLPTLAANRGMEPAKLTKLVRGELDWIVLKALEKDRSRRYDTASAFAADVQRYLNDEPVLAGPPSRWYRFRKFARRNRGAFVVVAAAVVVVLLAVAGLGVSNWLIRQERDEKEWALDKAMRETQRANQEKAHAQRQRDRANLNLAAARKAVKDYLSLVAQDRRLRTGDFHKLRKELLAKAIPFYEEFVRQKPEDAEWEMERGRAYDNLGFLRSETGDRPGALADYQRMRSVFQGLVEAHPKNPEYRRWLAESHINAAEMLLNLGNHDKAEQAYRRALSTGKKLVEEFPLDGKCRQTMARSYQNLSVVLRHLGRLVEAEEAARQAKTVGKKLVQDFPHVPFYAGQLAVNEGNLGSVLHALGRPADAQAAFERGLAGMKNLPAEHVSATPYLEAESSCHNGLGIILFERGRAHQAEVAWRQALAIHERLAASFPTVPQYRQKVAGSYNNLGILLNKLKQRDKAAAAYRQAISIGEKLLSEFPEIPVYAVQLAGSYCNLGRLFKEPEAALPWLAKSIDTATPIVKRQPRLAKARETLCTAHWERARSLWRLDRCAEAVKDWDRAVEFDDGSAYAEVRLMRSFTLLDLKDHARAAAGAEEVARFPKASANDLFKAAGVLAKSAELSQDHPALSEKYAARAVATLRQAVDRGFRDPVQLRAVLEFNFVRSRADFQQIQRELDERKRR
jgi:eukaryotic-like serine/threonine-protein kinase